MATSIHEALHSSLQRYMQRRDQTCCFAKHVALLSQIAIILGMKASAKKPLPLNSKNAQNLSAAAGHLRLLLMAKHYSLRGCLRVFRWGRHAHAYEAVHWLRLQTSTSTSYRQLSGRKSWEHFLRVTRLTVESNPFAVHPTTVLRTIRS